MKHKDVDNELARLQQRLARARPHQRPALLRREAHLLAEQLQQQVIDAPDGASGANNNTR